MLSQAKPFLVNLPSRISVRITPRTRIVAVSIAAISVSLWALIKLLRRKRKEIEDKEEDEVPATCAPFRPPSSLHASLRRKATQDYPPMTRRVRGSPSMCSSVAVPTSNSMESSVIRGLDSLTEALKGWEKAVEIKDSKVTRPDDLVCELEKLLEAGRGMQIQLQRVVEEYGLDTVDNMSLASNTGYYSVVDYATVRQCSLAGRRTMSLLSDDSFASALDDLVPIFADMDILLRDPLTLNISDLHFFHEGVDAVHSGLVLCRNMRTDFVQCETDTEFLAKLYCIRRAMQSIVSDATRRLWLRDTGKNLIGDIMRQSGRDSTKYELAYERMMLFLDEPDVTGQIAEELRTRKVPEVTFYDVVLDFILMDAFDDLASPPSAVLAVAQNKFLSASFKETTLATVVWSVLKAKRGRLQVENGFLSHFYDISEHVSPLLAWGFLGTDAALRDRCYYFKDQICSFLTDIFSFSRVRFTCESQLAEDIWQFLNKRVEMTMSMIVTDGQSN